MALSPRTRGVELIWKIPWQTRCLQLAETEPTSLLSWLCWPRLSSTWHSTLWTEIGLFRPSCVISFPWEREWDEWVMSPGALALSLRCVRVGVTESRTGLGAPHQNNAQEGIQAQPGNTTHTSGSTCSLQWHKERAGGSHPCVPSRLLPLWLKYPGSLCCWRQLLLCCELEFLHYSSATSWLQ